MKSTQQCFNKMRLLDYVLLHLDKKWDWFNLAKSKRINLQEILSHPELPWDWCDVSLNKNLTIHDVIAHPDIEWNWSNLSSHPNITMDDVLAFLDFPWDWYHVSRNPNVTLSLFIRSHFEGDWWGFSGNPNNDLNDVLDNQWDDEYQEYEFISLNYWKWDYLSLNINIKLEDILKYPKLPWEWSGIKNNHNIVLPTDPELLKQMENFHCGESGCTLLQLLSSRTVKHKTSTSLPKVRTNYVKTQLLNLLDNPDSKLCHTSFEL